MVPAFARELIELARVNAIECGETWVMNNNLIRTSKTCRCPMEMAAGVPKGHTFEAANFVRSNWPTADQTCLSTPSGMIILSADCINMVDEIDSTRKLMIRELIEGGSNERISADRPGS